MIQQPKITRRNFAKTLAAVLAASAVPLNASTGLNVGIGTYSYHNLSLDEMIVRLNALKVQEIEMSRGEFMLMNHPTEAMFRAARAKFDQTGIRCVSYYTATIKEDADLENAVSFAKILGARNVTGDATGAILNRIDQRFTQEKLTFGIHNHYFKGEKFAYESPEDVLDALRGLSNTVGATADVGHFASCGHDPVDAVRKLGSRLKLVHLKDIQAADGEVNVLLGKGIAKIPEVMKELQRQKFAGLVAVEYEKEGDVTEDMRFDVELARTIRLELKTCGLPRPGLRLIRRQFGAPGPGMNLPLAYSPRAVFSVVFLVLFSLGQSFGQANSTADPVADYVRAEIQRQHIPGAALLVAKAGKIVRADGYGLANVELQVPVKAETVFQSGSMGKQFAATGVMMLVEEGKIGLDDSLLKYFPDGPPAWKQVTVRELLSHTAGFTDYPEKFDFRKDWTEAELLKLVESIPLAYPPGTKWEYSNLGYLTLGLLMHRVTGEFYGDFLRERIFRPLGMQTTRIISEADIIPNRAAGYRLVKGELKNQEWVAPMVNTTADGSLYFSILDLAKWDAALYTETLLKKSSLEVMWTPVKLKNGQPNSDGYGFGWFVENRNGHHVVSHDGAWQGFETTIARYVDDQLTVVVLSNLAEGKPDAIAQHVAEMYLAASGAGTRPASRH